MRAEIARIVHPVVAYAVNLRRRLLAGQDPPLATEQAALLGLLQGEREARRLVEFGGEDPQSGDVSFGEHPSGPFLGARYALVCWLDEIFILDSPWGRVWNEHKLEVRLYSSNDRAWRFWEQARLAADRDGMD